MRPPQYFSTSVKQMRSTARIARERTTSAMNLRTYPHAQASSVLTTFFSNRKFLRALNEQRSKRALQRTRARAPKATRRRRDVSAPWKTEPAAPSTVVASYIDLRLAVSGELPMATTGCSPESAVGYTVSRCRTVNEARVSECIRHWKRAT